MYSPLTPGESWYPWWPAPEEMDGEKAAAMPCQPLSVYHEVTESRLRKSTMACKDAAPEQSRKQRGAQAASDVLSGRLSPGEAMSK